MDSIIEDLTGLPNPASFVGRNPEIEAFTNVLRDFVRSNDTVRWVHISGVAGTGKSSLLRKLRMNTEQERIATGSVEVPISPKMAGQFLMDIKLVIDEMAPEWRSFLRRKTKSEISNVTTPPEHAGEMATEEKLKAIVDTFFEDLDQVDAKLKEKKQRSAIFLDNIDRILNYGYTSILSIFPRIMKILKDQNYNVLFVTASHYRANRFLDLIDMVENNYVLHLEVNQFDFNEAELMIRRKGKLVKSERDLVVQSSTRFPFDLTLRQIIQSKGYDTTQLDARTITELFEFHEAEVKLLRDLAKSDINYFSLEEITRLHEIDTVNSLKNSLLFSISEDDYFIVDSYAMWDLISHVFKPIDPRTEAILILNRIKDQAEMSQLASRRDINIIRENFESIEDHGLIFELSGQLAETAKAALDGSLTKTAWDLLELATIGLLRTEDYEKIADLHESLAKGFSKVDKDYFAAKAYAAAGEYFKKADIEWKSVTNYREAGLKFHREAEKSDINLYHYAIRNLYKKAINAYLNANERKKARRVKEDAIEFLKDYEQHVSFFQEINLKGE